MSACISEHGEYSDHEIDEYFRCVWCGIFDENAAIMRLQAAEKVCHAATKYRQHAEGWLDRAIDPPAGPYDSGEPYRRLEEALDEWEASK